MINTYKGICHCGGVIFTVATDLASALRCNCSICQRKGAIMLAGEPGSFRLENGKALLRCYQFNSHVAEHYFCGHCGIYTHHKPRSNPDIFRVNAGCLDDLDYFSLEAGLNDGASLGRMDGVKR